MPLIDIDRLIVEHSLKCRNGNEHFDSVVFIGDDDDVEEVECYPGNVWEDFFKSEVYAGYNKNVSDEEWDSFYEECCELLQHITGEYGSIYRVMVDFKKEELVVLTRPENHNLRHILSKNIIPFKDILNK